MDGEKIGDILKKSVLAVMVICFAIVCIGTVSIPFILAYVYVWQWVLIYPGVLLLFFLLAPRKKE